MDAMDNSALRQGTPETAELAEYYENARWEFGYASLCHMSLPDDLSGKTVIDVGCRRGKGCFKLSELVGDHGRVIGIDWVKDHIAEAVAHSEQAARKSGLASNNMVFHEAYPENLASAGIGDNAIDVGFVNSVLHLMCDPVCALAELHRVLRPGGLLILEVALASGPRDPQVVSAARALGNSIQAAPFCMEFETALDQIGFEVEEAEPSHAIEPDLGYKPGYAVPTAPSDETVSFEALVLHARKTTG